MKFGKMHRVIFISPLKRRFFYTWHGVPRFLRKVIMRINESINKVQVLEQGLNFWTKKCVQCCSDSKTTTFVLK